MEQNNTDFLTEDGLVARLGELGYLGVTKRRVAAWRGQELIPRFDVIGAGRGQSLGRGPSGWSNGEAVICQAAEVCKLLKSYSALAELHFPLWVLGYPIPLERVREALDGPLDATMEFIEAEGGNRGEIEDKIGDDAFEFSRVIERSNIMSVPVPQDAIETFSNLLLNRKYDLTDTPFEDGLRSLQEFDSEFQQKAEAVFADRFPAKQAVEVSDDGMYTIFDNASFINEYLSVEALKKAVDECSDEDLVAVQRYLATGREVMDVLKEVVELFEVYFPPEFRLAEVDRTMIFTGAKLCVWSLLSLRRKGFGDLIEMCLAEIIKELPRELNEEVVREIKAAGPEIASLLEICLEQVMSGSLVSQQSLS